MLPDGPQAHLAPHMIICSFVSNLIDPRIDAVLRNLYTEIRRLSNCEREVCAFCLCFVIHAADLILSVISQLPIEGQCLADFSNFMTEAAKHGLIWVIDNLNLISGVDEWGFLSRVPKGE